MVGKIRKAAITAAGSGSRLLPFSKGTPKEMLPFCARSKDGRLILKPILEVVYESLYDHGCMPSGPDITLLQEVEVGSCHLVREREPAVA